MVKERRSPFDSPWVGVLIAAAVVAAFWPMSGMTFLGNDDFDYIRDNPHVRAGLTWAGARWALTSLDTRMWHPLTWLSLMLDAQLHGMADRGFLLTNLLLHAASAGLLFEFLRRSTGRPGPSALAALLWALHPMRVESIRWAGKRVDPLSMLFFTATLLAYERQTKKPTAGRRLGTVLCYAGAVFSKPSVVTLPFALLLLDAWPLRRWGRVPLKSLLLEKAPLFALAAFGSAMAPIAAKPVLMPLDFLPLRLRLMNVPYSYVKYLAKTIWPVGLPYFYPHPGETLSAAVVAACLAILALISAAVWRHRGEAPYLAFGWAWFLGTLVPMLELVQTYGRGMANHFMLIPHIGLAVAAAWGAKALLDRGPRLAKAGPALALGLVLLLAARSRAELEHWTDFGTLYEYSIANSGDNYFIHAQAGQYYLGLGRSDDAEREFREATRIRPYTASGHVNLGALYSKTGRSSAAEREFRDALALDRNEAAASRDLALLLSSEGRAAEAEPALRRALSLWPDDADLLGNLSEARLRLGDPAGAVELGRRASALAPDSPELHNNLGIALAAAGEKTEAELEFRKALKLRPGFRDARRNLETLEARP